MNISISLTMDTLASHKSNIVVSMSQELKAFFADRFYGEDIQNYIIGFTCVLPPEGFEHLYKKRKPVYVDDKTTKNRFTGEPHRMFKLFIDSIDLDSTEYADFVDSSDEEINKMLAKKILESLENLDKLPKKVKDFDKERFKQDMEEFFIQQSIL